ncbi:MAG: hypothetical protein IRZ16_10445 [Myxococcaceae bacterium]|nr:hypothetical protein [Myxococcaceae bacterium]
MRNNQVMKSLLVAAVLVSGAAYADGLLLSPAELPEASRAELAALIARAKKSSPESFEKVKHFVGAVPDWDARKRGRLAPASVVFRRIGDDALWPMVELIAFDAGPKSAWSEWSETARRALEIGLIEAAGAKRDVRLAPVWSAILDGPEQRFEILRASVEALAKLDTDAAAQKLIALARSDVAVKREAALAAMGNCRRLTVARALAEALDAHPEALMAKRIIRSLGDVGNAWAWQTPAVKARSEEGAIRTLAAEALLRAYLAYDGEARQAASNALLVVDAPQMPALIDRAKKGSPDEQRAALAGLERRWEQHPLR